MSDSDWCTYWDATSVEVGPDDDPEAYHCPCGKVVKLRRNPRSRQGAWMAPRHREPADEDVA